MRARALGLAGFAVLTACGGQPAQEAAAPASPAAASAAAAAVSDTDTDPDPALAEKMAAQKRIHAAACKPEETPVFSCKLTNGKRVAVCGEGEGTGHYRFGSGTGASELAIRGGAFASVMYSGGGESQIAFTNGNTRYIVFSRMVRTGFGPEGNNPAISDGVVVKRGGKLLDLKLCDDPDLLPIDLNTAGAVWEDQGELFTDATMQADPSGDE